MILLYLIYKIIDHVALCNWVASLLMEFYTWFSLQVQILTCKRKATSKFRQKLLFHSINIIWFLQLTEDTHLFCWITNGHHHIRKKCQGWRGGSHSNFPVAAQILWWIEFVPWGCSATFQTHNGRASGKCGHIWIRWSNMHHTCSTDKRSGCMRAKITYRHCIENDSKATWYQTCCAGRQTARWQTTRCQTAKE